MNGFLRCRRCYGLTRKPIKHLRNQSCMKGFISRIGMEDRALAESLSYVNAYPHTLLFRDTAVPTRLVYAGWYHTNGEPAFNTYVPDWAHEIAQLPATALRRRQLLDLFMKDHDSLALWQQRYLPVVLAVARLGSEAAVRKACNRAICEFVCMDSPQNCTRSEL